jgi:phosphopantothenoylcysteine decarboxylase / phosphopantothenate---cysteine ligase
MKVLISAGPTREYLDPVRFISNPSTGRMGFLISEECMKKGHSITLVSGPTNLKPPLGVTFISVESTEDMRREILKVFPDVDVLIMSAAVSDWRPARKSKSKIKQKRPWSLKLIPNPDIIKEVSKIKRDSQKVIGFALETTDIVKNAKRKLKEKKIDLIIGDTPDFFGTQNKGSKVIFLWKDGRIIEFKKITKEQTAQKLVSLLEDLTK